MRVGLVVTGGVDRSGRERVIPILLAFLDRLARRHDVHVFVLAHEPAPTTYRLVGATIHDLGRTTAPRGFTHVVQDRKLRHAIAALGGVDVLHGYWGVPGIVAAAAGRALRIPTVITANSGEWTGLPDISYGLQLRWRTRAALARAMRAARAVTVCTDFMRQLAAAHGIDARVIPMGLPRAPMTAQVRASADCWRLLHVASINPVKDHATLLRAVADMRAHAPIHLDVVGQDTLDGAAARHADALGVSDLVTFHGFLAADALAPLWANADLHLVSSRHEAAGVVTLEAAMAGVPTLGTRVGYIADGAPARAAAVPVGDAPALARAALDLLADAGARERLRTHARAWVETHDADATANAFDALYHEVSQA